MSAIVRKRTTKMTDSERDRFKEVIDILIQNGKYGKLVSHHMNMKHLMHSMGNMALIGRQRFLPWHRVYLLRLEEAMRAIDPLCFIPYWDWTRERRFPSWLEDFTPSIKMPDESSISVVRNIGLPPLLPTKSHMKDVMSETTYTDFTTALEFAHNIVHVWVGGTMATMSSPADPVFWLHHANIDRLWAIWQKKPSNSGKGPELAGKHATMKPWKETVKDVASISDLNYSYAP